MSGIKRFSLQCVADIHLVVRARNGLPWGIDEARIGRQDYCYSSRSQTSSIPPCKVSQGLQEEM